MKSIFNIVKNKVCIGSPGIRRISVHEGGILIRIVTNESIYACRYCLKCIDPPDKYI